MVFLGLPLGGFFLVCTSHVSFAIQNVASCPSRVGALDGDTVITKDQLRAIRAKASAAPAEEEAQADRSARALARVWACVKVEDQPFRVPSNTHTAMLKRATINTFVLPRLGFAKSQAELWMRIRTISEGGPESE